MLPGEQNLERNGDHAEPDGLVHAFEAVLKELDRIRQESEATHRQLLQRNRELAAIAAVAQATSTGEMDLAGTLQRALQVVLEVTGLPAGWVLLLPQDGAEAVLADFVGLPVDLAEKLAGFRSPECECMKVFDTRRPLLVHPLHAGCPIQALDLGNGRWPTCHATVPLLTRSRWSSRSGASWGGWGVSSSGGVRCARVTARQMARVMAGTAYVEKAVPRSGSKRSNACHSPMRPTCSRSA